MRTKGWMHTGTHSMHAHTRTRPHPPQFHRILARNYGPARRFASLMHAAIGGLSLWW